MQPSVIQRLRYRLWSAPVSPRHADRALLQLGTFKQVGWFESVRRGRPVDRSGNPLPWYTYAAIYWLDHALVGTETVFEYGCGNSTLWFARHVKCVAAVEHDQAWANTLQRSLPVNATLHYVPTDASEASMDTNDAYVCAIAQTGTPYDVIVVDGKARNACCLMAVSHLRQDGLLILDNSDRSAYEPANAFLQTEGFARIDFVGPAPGIVGWSATSVYSRDLNRWSRRRTLVSKPAKTIGDFVD
jgi:hypothetical protein